MNNWKVIYYIVLLLCGLAILLTVQITKKRAR